MLKMPKQNMRQKIPEIPLSLFCIVIYWPPLSVSYISIQWCCIRETNFSLSCSCQLALEYWLWVGAQIHSPSQHWNYNCRRAGVFHVTCHPILPPPRPTHPLSFLSIFLLLLSSFLFPNFHCKKAIDKDLFSTVCDVLILMPFNLFQNFSLYLLSQIVYLEAFE